MTPLYQHQKEDLSFLLAHPRACLLNDPGTGKTRTVIEVIKARKHEGRTLVLCPKSIMAPAWGEDLKKFAPELRYTLAYAEKRTESFFSPSDIVIMNHDGITWLEKVLKKNPTFLNGFCQLIIDESTAFKNQSGRSNALQYLKTHFKYRIIMTGTIYTNSLTDIWRQILAVDDGERLGNSFFRFRNQVCVGRQLGNGITIWEDKPNMEPVIFHLINDIAIRRTLESCIDIPENTVQEIPYTLNKTHAALYQRMEDDAQLEIGRSSITAVNAAVLAGKLLQIASGAVYDSYGNYQLLDEDRYELIRDLAEARPQCIIAFHWRHQKEQLLKRLPNARVIDGEISTTIRNRTIEDFQKGLIPQLLIHPQSGAHGLTLTAGHATIWASPTYSSEQFTQFNRRIYRAGQTKKTETLLVTAKNTIEDVVYQKLEGKLTRMNNILSLFEQL